MMLNSFDGVPPSSFPSSSLMILSILSEVYPSAIVQELLFVESSLFYMAETNSRNPSEMSFLILKQTIFPSPYFCIT